MSYERYRDAEAGVGDTAGKQFLQYLADPAQWFSLEESTRLEV